MTDTEKKLLQKKFSEMDISDIEGSLLTIVENHPSLIPEEIQKEYKIYEEKQEKKREAKAKKDGKTDKLIKKFMLQYPKEKESFFRDLIYDFENTYPLDISITFTRIAKKSKALEYEEILDLYYNYEFEDLKTACKSYKIKYKTINTAITRVLQELINQTKEDIVHTTSKSDINNIFDYVLNPDEVEGSTEKYDKLDDIQKEDYQIFKDIKNIDNLIKKSLNYLRCFGIAYFQKTGKYTKYHIKLSDWFDDRKYSIANKELLKMLMPLMVEYIKSSEKINVNSFFEKIDSVLEYVLQPFENHNENFELEKYFLDNMKNEVSIRILDASGSKNNLTLIMNEVEIHTKILTVIAIKIVFAEDKKYLEYSDENDDIFKVPLAEIIRAKIYDTNIIKYIKENLTQDFSCVSAYIIDKDIKDNDKYYVCNPKYLEAFEDKVSNEDQLYKIILELPLTALEFFLIQPLNNMTIYAKADEIVEFEKIIETKEVKAIINGDFKIKDSHFYVIANDTLNNATAIVLDTLSDIRIVAPVNLHKKIISIFHKYSGNSKL